jgi:hypothetical protein
MVQSCRNQRFGDHLCPRPQGCWSIQHFQSRNSISLQGISPRLYWSLTVFFQLRSSPLHLYWLLFAILVCFSSACAILIYSLCYMVSAAREGREVEIWYRPLKCKNPTKSIKISTWKNFLILLIGSLGILHISSLPPSKVKLLHWK